MKFKRDDGTGRPPRPLQEKALTWVEVNWEGPETLAIQAPPGVGKSWLARVIQAETKGMIIVPSNLLMDDTYTKVYSTVNFLKGKTHYECKDNPGFTCHENTAALKNKPCDDCPYTACKVKALNGAPTFYNPMSLFYLQKDNRYRIPDVIIVDEAHQLRDMLLLIAGKQFRRGKYNFPETESEIEIIEWMQKQYVNLGKLYKGLLEAETRDNESIADVVKEIESIDATLKGLKENPQNYCIYQSEGQHRGKSEKFLNVVPLEPPKFLVDQLLRCKKLILLSATLPRARVETLLNGRTYKYLDMPSPIDKSRRRIHYRPMPFKVNYKTDPAAIAQHIEGLLKEFPGLNTIIHASYALAKKLAPHFNVPVITHTSEAKDKKAALDRFIAEGGILLASGMSEGIDLKGKLGELNIIPVIHKMNPSEPAVKKRMAWKDGRRWYRTESLMTTVQEAGRTTRGEDDRSTIIICDPAFPGLVSDASKDKDISSSFVEAIKWSR